VNLINSVNVNGVTGVGKLAVRTGTDENAHFRTATAIGGTGVGLDMLNDASSAVVGFTLRASATRLTGGVVSITDSTAGSASAGALVVTGGLSAGNNGNASYFGGAVTGTSLALSGGITTGGNVRLANAFFLNGRNAANTSDIPIVKVTASDVLEFGSGGFAATFAGAVTIAGTVIHTLSATPASASATGTVGTMSWDASYIYICTATNTWKRVAIATW
jgi:hypothetical protein